MDHRTMQAIAVWSARGGHGATTVAATLGALLAVPVLCADGWSLEWMSPQRTTTNDTRAMAVRDGGPFRGGLSTHTNIVVLRGPSSLGILSLARAHATFEHLVLIRDQHSCLREVDVEQALRTRIAATIPLSPNISRLCDAGRIASHAHDLDELADLRAWTLRTWPDVARQRPS